MSRTQGVIEKVRHHVNVIKSNSHPHVTNSRSHLESSVQPIADRMAQNLEIISKTFSTNQNSAHGIYD